DATKGYYDDKPTCETNNAGKICTSSTEYGVTCFKPTETACDRSVYTFNQACTHYSGMHEVNQCTDINGTYYDCEPNDCEGYTETGCYTGTIVADQCQTNNATGTAPVTKYKCQCDEVEHFSSNNDIINDCGSKGSNGWQYVAGSYSGQTCYTCQAKDCPTGSSSETCETVSGLTLENINDVDGSFNGQIQCHYCSYSCEMGTYNDEAECIEDNDGDACKSTVNKNLYGIQHNCYTFASLVPAIENTVNLKTIEKTSTGTDDVYGMKSENDLRNASQDITSSYGKINITHNSTGNAYGMYASSANSLTNDAKAEINIENNSTGNAVGMFASTGASVNNAGSITITGSGTNTGILGLGENQIENSGTIDVTGDKAYGIRVIDGTNTTITNSGTIKVDGTTEAYGIYVDQNANASTVTNTGTIEVNGNVNDTNRAIVLNGAELRNRSLMSVSGNLDLNSIGASRVYLENGATYKADTIEGDLTAGTSTVMNDNLDTYVEKGAIKADKTDKLNISSESALFEASTKQNTDGSTDVVLTRKSFDNFAPNSSIASALTKDYQDGKLENTFNKIKQASTDKNLSSYIANVTGADTMLNFADENFQVLKNLNRSMADTILKPTNEKNRVVAGYANYSLETDNKGLLSGYDLSSNSMYTFGDKRIDNWSRLGLGLSFTDINSSYELGGDRDLNIVSVFVPYLRNIKENLNLVSILNLGYGYGDYDRGSNREADIEQLIYGLTNELRYTIDLNGFAELEPALMLNTIGYYEKGFDEGNATDAIETKSANNLSVELGTGLFFKKEFTTEKYGKFGFKFGGAYYHEFANPYRDISMRIKNGSRYKLDDYANLYQRDRAVIETMIDYVYKDISLYLKYNKLIQKNNPDLFDMGIKYNF
ncbi:MAG: hypothetical protein IKW39_05045, partial [Alphaproteobacteria bacterium]|nr:hypothetical protein [Alphaproteobacteria bacterium]